MQQGEGFMQQVATEPGGEELSLAERAYRAIRDRLVMLDIRPGAPINEDQLAQSLGVGRTPVREALKRLQYERLITTYPRRGTFATDVNITDLAHISEVRQELEPLAAAQAARRATAADRGGPDGPAAGAGERGPPSAGRRRAHAPGPPGPPRHLRRHAQPVPGGHPRPPRQPGHPHLVPVHRPAARHGRPRRGTRPVDRGDRRRRPRRRRPSSPAATSRASNGRFATPSEPAPGEVFAAVRCSQRRDVRGEVFAAGHGEAADEQHADVGAAGCSTTGRSHTARTG